MIAPTQLINIQRGTHEVAIDLSAEQAQTIKGNKRLNVDDDPVDLGVLAVREQQPGHLVDATPNKHFQAAVRYALDYRSIVSVAGAGAIQARGIIPSMFLGALPPKGTRSSKPHQGEDVSSPRRGSATGRSRSSIPSDLTINGVAVRLARAARAGEPAGGRVPHRARRRDGRHVAAEVPRREDGVRAFSVGARLPGSLDYLAFMPGELVGTRAGWPAGSDPTVEKLAARARVTSRASVRQTIYRQIQRRLNAVGPFFPLLQPTQVFVSTKDPEERGLQRPVPGRRHAGRGRRVVEGCSEEGRGSRSAAPLTR